MKCPKCYNKLFTAGIVGNQEVVYCKVCGFRCTHTLSPEKECDTNE